MCMPLGPRRSWGSRWEGHTPVERITKAEVDQIIDSGEFECFCKRGVDVDFQEYDGCMNNLKMILHNGKTRVKVAGAVTLGYLSGYRTVVMIAPCMDATILLRTEL